MGLQTRTDKAEDAGGQRGPRCWGDGWACTPLLGTTLFLTPKVSFTTPCTLAGLAGRLTLNRADPLSYWTSAALEMVDHPFLNLPWRFCGWSSPAITLLLSVSCAFAPCILGSQVLLWGSLGKPIHTDGFKDPARKGELTSSPVSS